MVKQIPLTKGKVALVDDADFEHLNQWKWHYNPVCRTGYARRIATIDGKRTLIYMHHDILGIPALGMEADHISTDGCDNRRENLRWGTRAQNLMNSRKRGGGSSRFKGVCWNTQKQQWMATITLGGKLRHLGFFDDEIEASRAYDVAALELFGEFARPNGA